MKPPPDVPGTRVGHRQRERRRDRGVDGVAPGPEDGCAGVGGQAGGRDHEPGFRGNGLSRDLTRHGGQPNNQDEPGTTRSIHGAKVRRPRRERLFPVRFSGLSRVGRPVHVGPCLPMGAVRFAGLEAAAPVSVRAVTGSDGGVPRGVDPAFVPAGPSASGPVLAGGTVRQDVGVVEHWGPVVEAAPTYCEVSTDCQPGLNAPIDNKLPIASGGTKSGA